MAIVYCVGHWICLFVCFSTLRNIDRFPRYQNAFCSKWSSQTAKCLSFSSLLHWCVSTEAESVSAGGDEQLPVLALGWVLHWDARVLTPPILENWEGRTKLALNCHPPGFCASLSLLLGLIETVLAKHILVKRRVLCLFKLLLFWECEHALGNMTHKGWTGEMTQCREHVCLTSMRTQVQMLAALWKDEFGGMCWGPVMRYGRWTQANPCKLPGQLSCSICWIPRLMRDPVVTKCGSHLKTDVSGFLWPQDGSPSFMCPPSTCTFPV